MYLINACAILAPVLHHTVMCKRGLHLGFLIQTSVDEIVGLFFVEEYLSSCPDLSTSFQIWKVLWELVLGRLKLESKWWNETTTTQVKS